MAVFKIEIPRMAELKEAIKGFDKDARPRLKHGLMIFCSTVADAARLKVPVQTGRLQTSITSNVAEEAGIIKGEVGSNVIYAPYVELGTGIYGPAGKPIRPKNKKILAWVSSGPRPTTPDGWKKAVLEGRAVFAKEVKGMRPRPFLMPALNENINKLVDILKKELI
jgi:HK97 gp10 family phage protein